MRAPGQLLLTLAIVAVASLVVWLGVYCLIKDDPPPQDDDLQVRREAVPEADNAYTYFAKAVAALREEEEVEVRDRIDQIFNGEAWDAALVARQLTQNEEALRLWTQGMAAPRCQLPQWRNWVDTVPAGFYGLLQLAELLSLRCVHLHKGGKEKDAFDGAVELVRFGQRVQTAKPSRIGYLVGKTLKDGGLDRLRALVHETTLGPDELKPYVARLRPYSVSDEAVADAFRDEYRVVMMVEDAMAGEQKPKAAVRPVSPTVPLFRRFYWKRNRTRAAAAETLRAVIRLVPRTYADALPEVERLRCKMRDRKASVRWPYGYLHPNLSGDQMLCMLLPSLLSPLEQKCKENVSVGAVRLLIAIRGFEKTHGRLPERPAELVPEFIDSVPIDDFDGKPLRWSRGRQAVYSVGKDLTDDSGDDTQVCVPVENLSTSQWDAKMYGYELGSWIEDDRSDEYRRDLVFHLNPADDKEGAEE